MDDARTLFAVLLLCTALSVAIGKCNYDAGARHGSCQEHCRPRESEIRNGHCLCVDPRTVKAFLDGRFLQTVCDLERDAPHGSGRPSIR